MAAKWTFINTCLFDSAEEQLMFVDEGNVTHIITLTTSDAKQLLSCLLDDFNQTAQPRKG